MGGGGPENEITAMIAFLGDGSSEDPQLYGARPFVPALKTWLLVYRSEERKITIGPVCIRIEYKSVQFEFSFPPTGKSKWSEGVDFGDGTGGDNSDQIWKVFLKKLGSGLGLRSSR